MEVELSGIAHGAVGHDRGSQPSSRHDGLSREQVGQQGQTAPNSMMRSSRGPNPVVSKSKATKGPYAQDDAQIDGDNGYQNR